MGDDDDDDDGSDTEEEDDVEVADAQFGKSLGIFQHKNLYFKKCNFVQSATLMMMTAGMTMATMMTMIIKIVRLRRSDGDFNLFF